LVDKKGAWMRNVEKGDREEGLDSQIEWHSLRGDENVPGKRKIVTKKSSKTGNLVGRGKGSREGSIERKRRRLGGTWARWRS